MDLAEKIKTNIWDNIDDFLKVLKAARTGQWHWYSNPKCKYVELRVDMRDGGCIIKDSQGTRISPEDLAYQYGQETPANDRAMGLAVGANGIGSVPKQWPDMPFEMSKEQMLEAIAHLHTTENSAIRALSLHIESMEAAVDARDEQWRDALRGTQLPAAAAPAASDDTALLRQCLSVLELSLPAKCGQSDDLLMQERANHRAVIAALQTRLNSKI